MKFRVAWSKMLIKRMWTDSLSAKIRNVTNLLTILNFRVFFKFVFNIVCFNIVIYRNSKTGPLKLQLFQQIFCCEIVGIIA